VTTEMHKMLLRNYMYILSGMRSGCVFVPGPKETWTPNSWHKI